jgi:trafficking protein particle complex subunit 13
MLYYFQQMCLTFQSTVIHVGENFTAYLGALNVSNTHSVRGLTVTAQLQTPSQRLALPSSLDA